MANSNRITAGNSDAAEEAAAARFHRCFDAHYADVLAFAARRVSDASEAEDVLAETFTVAWRRREAIPAPALPWLLGVARRMLANRRRAERRADQLAVRLASEPQSHPADPSDLVLGRITVLRAFAELREGDREVLRLIAWEGLSAAEAASVLGCSRAACRVRLHRARRKLERKLQAEEEVRLPQSTVNPSSQECA